MESQWQEREMRRSELIREAVEKADLVLINGANGTEEELNYLTAQVAQKFMEKAFFPFQSSLMRKDMEADHLIRTGLDSEVKVQ